MQEWDPKLAGVKEYPELRTAVKRWAEQQDGQRILLTTPSVLVGYRVEVYRAEGTTQWYTAVIIGYNEATRVSLQQLLRHTYLRSVIMLTKETFSCNC